MDYLYSRPRIKLPQILIINQKKYRKIHKYKFIIVILFLLIFIIISIIKAITPVFNKLCEDKAKGIATLICNRQTSRCLKEYNYSDFIIIHMDDEKNIKMLEANMKNINLVVSDITEKIQQEIDNTGRDNIYIRLGSFTGINLLSGSGPKIPIKISTNGNINTDFKSEFIEKRS